MAIAFRAASSGNQTNGCANFNITMTKPTGTVDNDVLVALVNVRQSCCGAPTSITTPSGWQLEDSEVTYTTRTKAELYSKKAASEGASWTVAVDPNASVCNVFSYWLVVAYSGCDTTTWIDATTTAGTNASSTNLTAPDIVTVTANAMVLNLYSYLGTGTVTDAGGTTQRVNVQNANGSVYCAEQLFASAGATGTRVATIVGAKVSRGFSVAMRPAAAGGSIIANPITGALDSVRYVA